MKSTKHGWRRTGVLLGGLFWLIAVRGVATAQSGSDVPAKLGLEPAAAKESVLDSLASGSVYNGTAIVAFKALPVAARAAIVQAGLGWIKAYAQSAEFKKAYLEFRDSKKPAPPAVRPSADEALTQQKAEFEKQIAETRKNMGGLDAAMKKTMEETIRQMRAQMEAMEKDPEQKKIMGQMTDMQRDEDQKQYAGRLKDWNEKFPADPRVLIKKRIADFLSASAGVDYAAKLAARGDKMVFVRDDYEQKSPEWKVCFRAGKEATEAARAFAKAWLVELEKK